MGSKKDGEELKQHPWFKGMDWAKLLKKEVDTPFKPAIAGDGWQENFDRQFIEEDAINSYAGDGSGLN